MVPVNFPCRPTWSSDTSNDAVLIGIGLAGFAQVRVIPVQFEKTDASSVALIHFACAIISWRRVGVI